MQQYTVNSGIGRGILLATILASAMAFLMGTAVSIALPTIQSELNASISEIQWVVITYTLVLASLILICGSLGDHYGRKRIFRFGIILFIVGSTLSGLSSSIEQLIAFQAVQGIGAAMMIPGSLAIINIFFPEAHRGQAIGLWAGFSGGIAALGPFVGGWLVEFFSWHSVFLINIPIGLLALLITTKFVPESRNPDAGSVDWFGTIFITLGLIGISFGFIQGPVLGWSSIEILLSLIGGISAIICFVIIESRVRDPIMPLKIFKNPLVLGANLVTFFLYFALNGVIFFLVLNFQQVQNYSPILAGLGLLPPILIITFFSGKSGSIADKIGARPQMILGPMIVSIGLALFIIPGVGDNYFTHFFPGLILFGSGMALVIAPLTKSALSVHKEYSGSASGVNNAVSRIAAMIAIAALGALMITIFTINLNESVNASPLSDDEKSQILIQTNKLGGIDIPRDFSESSRIIAKDSVNNSFIYGFRWAMGLSSLFAFIGSIISFITIHNPKHGNSSGKGQLN